MSFSIPITNNINEINLQEGVFLFIHRASKIPPHIGMVVNGVLYEISTTGPGYQYQAVDLLNTAQKRGVELIFLELEKVDLEQNFLSDSIEKLVKHYYKVDDEVSCLFPIKDFIKEVYQLDVSRANFIFELLPILYDNNFIVASYQVNLTNQLVNNSFILKKYTKKDVQNCIASVNRKNKIGVGF